MNKLLDSFYKLMVILLFAMIIGWLVNIYKLISDCDYESPYKCEITRSVGTMIPPVGGVIGWMDLGK